MADPVSVRFSDDERRELGLAARVRDVPMSAIVREAVRRHLEMNAGEDTRLDDFERRIARLEEMAGL